MKSNTQQSFQTFSNNSNYHWFIRA